MHFNKNPDIFQPKMVVLWCSPAARRQGLLQSTASAKPGHPELQHVSTWSIQSYPPYPALTHLWCYGSAHEPFFLSKSETSVQSSYLMLQVLTSSLQCNGQTPSIQKDWQERWSISAWCIKGFSTIRYHGCKMSWHVLLLAKP